MEEKMNTKQGSLNISEEVIRTIITRSVSEFKGVEIAVEEAAALKKFFIVNDEGSIRINLDNDVVAIGLRISVNAGYNVIDLTENLQKKIKRDIQNMTGITVSGVNIQVDDIIFEENRAV